MNSFTAACFDLDGTLIDTEPVHIQAESECLSVLGIYASDPRRPRTFGMGIESGMRLLAGTFELDFAAVLNTYLPLWEKGLHANLKMLPGAKGVMAWLSDHKIPLALVTSGDTAYVDLVDSALGLKSAFEVIVTSESLQRTKPDPAPYLEAARRLGVPPKACLGFEDSGAGVTALNAAGMFSVAIHPAYGSRPELQTAKLQVIDFDSVQPLLGPWFG